nr:hypothetical protein [Tanacetum cinerariifolium]GEX65616.1 hypothetical protein [Tanacetum cinerariifolium]
MEALGNKGKIFDTLMDLKDDREAARTKLQGLNELITQAEQEIEKKEAYSSDDWLKDCWLRNGMVSFALVSSFYV